jgi:virginiamycin B lyase
LIVVIVMIGLSAFAPSIAAEPLEAFSGAITDMNGNPIAGAMISARNRALGMSTTVYADADGRYSFPDLPLGADRLRVYAIGYDVEEITLNAEMSGDLSLTATSNAALQYPSSSFLDLLPNNEDTRAFIIGCGGCHGLDYSYQRSRRWLTESQWATRVAQMLNFYGPQSGFPIIPERDAAATAAWLVEYLNPERDADLAPPIYATNPDPESANAVITEYDFPGAGPHDVYVLDDGRIAVTGMFSFDMWTLDPATAEFTQYDMPSGADPRAITVAEDGAWWLVFGSLNQIARFDPATGDLRRWSIRMYAHSIALDSQGRAWANGHFTNDPVRVAMIDPDQTLPTFFNIPTDTSNYQDGLPISYDLAVAPDGGVWISDLHWNRMTRLDPETGESTFYELPQSLSAPRRFDIDSAGMIWIPEYAGGRLARLDPAAGEFTEWELPITNATPYVVKVDESRGRVWIALSGADAVARFDVATETFTLYPLPTQSALMRHMGIDGETGDVWVSYQHVPTVEDKVTRIHFPSRQA